MRYKAKKSIELTANLSYCVGLLAADGCLQNDNRHIDLTSKDIQQLETFRSIVRPDVKISSKHSGMGLPYFRVQFSDVVFYDFLLMIGLHPRKSKTLKSLAIPDTLFPDFFRGCFDGDGCITAYYDKRWKNSYMYYTSIVSASLDFILWIQETVARLCQGITGHIRKSGLDLYQLAYAKKDSRLLFDFMYYHEAVPRLTRKYNRYLEIFTEDPYYDRAVSASGEMVNTSV
jgi:hypothetical protein